MKMQPVIAARTDNRRTIALGFAAAFLLVAAAALINPVGYVGSGADDEQYLAAARCWLAHGQPCLPPSHWWTRWPAFAPIAGLTGLFGESRLTVGLGPGFYWLASLGLTGWLGTLWFGWRAGAIAMALLGTAPSVAAEAFDPNVDMVELAFQLAGLVAATIAVRRQSRLAALTTGLAAALAIETRDTSILMLGVGGIAWLTLKPSRRQVLLWAIPAFAATIAAEMLVYWQATGDPLARYRLALGHVNIPSFALPAGFHSNRGPLLNPDYMKSWRREAGITWWWPIDPWLNLLATPRCAFLLIGSILSSALLWRRMPITHRRLAVRVVGAAVVVALLLTYGLAIDPKPRMFMSLWAALALVSGAALAGGLASVARPLALALACLPPLLGIAAMKNYPASAGAEARARHWIALYGKAIELDQGAASYLTLLPEARALAPRGFGRPYLVVTSASECETLIKHTPGAGPDGRVIDQISGTNPRQGYLCLFEYLPARRAAS